MAYIGEKPSQTLASPTSQYFNGTGSQTAFTLNRPVNVSEDLEVFVNNIQQEPGVGKSYTASGTTLTFDAAPSSGTGNVYVVYRGLAEVTTRLEHDSNAALAATTGTFSGAVSAASATVTGNLTVDTDTLYVDSANDKVGINGAPVTSGSALPFLDVHGGQAEHGVLIRTGDTNVAGGGGSVLQFGFNTNASYRHNVRTRHDSAVNANNAIEFYTWNTAQNSADLGNRKVLSVSDVGVTMPYQPAFRAYGNTQGAISSGEFTGYTTTDFNTGNHFSVSTGRFTAPVNGVYFFRADFRSNQAQGSGNMYVDIRKNGANVVCRHEEVGASFNAFHQTFAGIIYMNAGDYASIIVGGGGSNFQPDNSPTDSFAGFLVG